MVDPHSKSTVATAVFTHAPDRDFSLDKSCRDFASTPRLGRRRRKSRCRPAGWFAKVAARMAYRLSLTHTGIQRRARVHVHRSRPASACTPRVAHHASLHRPPRGECIGGRSRLTLAGSSKRMIKLSDPSPFAGSKGRKQATCSAFGLNPPTRPSKGSPVQLARAPCVIAGPNERSRCICGKRGLNNHMCDANFRIYDN